MRGVFGGGRRGREEELQGELELELASGRKKRESHRPQIVKEELLGHRPHVCPAHTAASGPDGTPSVRGTAAAGFSRFLVHSEDYTHDTHRDTRAALL